MVYIRKVIAEVEFVVRDFERGDVEFFVNYWHGCDPDYLRNIGIDPSKRPSPEVTRQKLLTQIGTDKSIAESWRFAITRDGRMIGCLNVTSIKRGKSAECHAHIFEPQDRAQGYAKSLAIPSLLVVFQTFNLELIVLRPSEKNVAPNQVLEAFGIKAVQVVDEPAGPMTLARIASVYQITRSQLQGLSGDFKP